MPPGTAPSPVLQLDQFVRAYETAQEREGQADLVHFLPPAGHPLFRDVLLELIRVDQEILWERGCPRDLRDYQRLFPDLLHDPASLQLIAFEEYRLRCQAGEPVTPEEYEFRFGVAVASWPRPAPTNGVPASPAPVDRRPETGGLPGPNHGEPVRAYSGDGRRLEADAQPQGWPRAGARFLDFTLLGELGRGTFARVYLARQPALADRLVALKISPRESDEPQTLAQLQHTHIVPIYSIHRDGPWQAVCMPYFGTTTLADVLKHLEGRPTLPQSGRELLETLEVRKSITHPTGDSQATDHGSTPSSVPASGLIAAAGGLPVLPSLTPTHLERLTYVETVLWLAVRLADGLAHAHERGILHRDLKPANILLTDEGQPMLLDFNLSEDLKAASPTAETRVGGTLPYMAPEQLEAFAGGQNPVDARSDVYALGVILFELLTGKPPYPLRRGPLNLRIPELLADRRQAPPRLRHLNPAVSPAVESIVRHCLEPAPARRYQSAAQLREDLQRHLDQRPLAHAPEPSWRERWGKWRRRHPRLTSSVTVSLVALGLLAGFLGYLSHHLNVLAAEQRKQEQLGAVATLQQLRTDLPWVRYLLRAANVEPAQRAHGWAQCRHWLDRYGVLEGPGWQQRSAAQTLDPDDQQRLRVYLGELLLHGARLHLLRAAGATEASRQEPLDQAQQFIQLAEACYAPEAPPPTLWQQQAELLRLRGDEPQARQLEERAANAAWSTPRDDYLLIWDRIDRGNLSESIPLLLQRAKEAPNNPLLWILLGDRKIDAGRPAEAVHYYNLAILQEADRATAHFNRGAAYLALQMPREALADFDSILRQGEDPLARFHSALARMGLQDFRGAEADLTKALQGENTPVRAWFARARVRERLGNSEGARQDRAEGFRREPRDEADWVARAVARLPGDPKNALIDLDKALLVNPRFRSALQSKAHVLAEYLRRPADAVQVLDRTIALYPDFPAARAGRGVVRARLGQRDAAHEDAAEMLRREPRAEDLYRVACIYALTSRQQAADRREALRHLAAALRQGFGGEHLAGDPDLEPIRSDPEFQRLARAAQELRGESARKPGP